MSGLVSLGRWSGMHTCWMLDPQQFLPFLWLPSLSAGASSLSLLFKPRGYRNGGGRSERRNGRTEGCSRSRGGGRVMKVGKPNRLTLGQWAEPRRRVCLVCIFWCKSVRVRWGPVYDRLECYAIGMSLDRDRGRDRGGRWYGRRWLCRL